MPMTKNLFMLSKPSLKKYCAMNKYLLVTDLVLLLLLVGKVRGTTKLQKQVFLTWKEIFPKTSIDPVFYPWIYGAYSKVVEDSVKILSQNKDVVIKRGRGEGMIYQISSDGEKRIKKRIRQLHINLEKLRTKKIDWDDWSTKGTLRYVYRKYPEYATKTRVPSLKWV